MSIINAPQLPPELTPQINLKMAIRRDESLVGVMSRQDDISGVTARALSIAESKLVKLTATGADLEKLSLIDVAIVQSDFTAANCAEASWQRIELNSVRGTGVKLQTSVLKDVRWNDCKLDVANFRFAKLKNVCFQDCMLDEADFYMAELENVQFQNCSLAKTEFSSARCKVVDLRTSNIAEITGLTGLKGAVIDSIQLVAIAPRLANHMGIQVKDA